MISELKTSLIAVIEVIHQSKACRVRINDPSTYTFDHLRCDASRFWGVDEDEFVLQDSQGQLWGSMPTSCLFDNDLKQQEGVFLVSTTEADNPKVSVPEKPEGHEDDEEDFNEDNPHHVYASSPHSFFMDESKVSSRHSSQDSPSKTISSFNSQPSQIRSRIMTVKTGFDRLQDSSQRAEAEAAQVMTYGKA
jgi:hypothetical protein